MDRELFGGHAEADSVDHFNCAGWLFIRLQPHHLLNLLPECVRQFKVDMCVKKALHICMVSLSHLPNFMLGCKSWIQKAVFIWWTVTGTGSGLFLEYIDAKNARADCKGIVESMLNQFMNYRQTLREYVQLLQKDLGYLQKIHQSSDVTRLVPANELHSLLLVAAFKNFEKSCQKRLSI